MTVVKVWGVDSADFLGGKLVWSALNALRPAKSKPPTGVDLSQLQLARPYTLAAVAALGCLARRQADLALPATQDARDYVIRSGLLDFFTCSEASRLSPSTRIVPVRQLEQVSSSFADEISYAWEHEFGGLPTGLRLRLADHLDEIIRNALSHAESPIGCIVAATVYPKRREVELCVLDLGQTIRRHLTTNPRYSTLRDDTEAIVAATEEGVTGTPAGALNRIGEPNSGVGLFELRSYCEAGGGDLVIVSGNAIVSFATGRAPTPLHFAGEFPGSMVNVRFTVR